VLAFSGGPIDVPGWPERNLHTDDAKAREAGLAQIIASGTQSEGLLIGFLIEIFGDDWYRGGELDVRFVKPVRAGDTVLPCVRCTASEEVEGALRLELECWCEVGDGTRVVDGSARCMVSGATRSPAAE
jgi:acyl dehydratase